MVLLGKILAAPLDFALPKRCAGCGIITGEVGFCTPCWQKLNLLPDEGCLSCNAPMDIPGALCGPCLAEAPKHDGVLAAVEYGEIARGLALKLKYGRKPGMARHMAALMARHAGRFPEALLVPVPLHRWRIWQRGFNQSLLLAREISSITKQDVEAAAVVRRKRTQPLGGLSRFARSKEMRGAFAVEKQARERVQGRHILLVDDVYTTGSTTNAVATILKRAGATKVHVLAWARVLQHEG